MENKQQLKEAVLRILRGLGLPVDDSSFVNSHVCNTVTTKQYDVNGIKVHIEADDFDPKCRIDINFYLPEEGVKPSVYMDYCAAIEKTPKNHHHEYCHGPVYKDFSEENRNRNTFAITPWDNTMFYVRSERYLMEEITTAADNALALALQFYRHLPEYASLRYWKTSDPEVIEKAKEIVRNADFQETDCDREERAHFLKDNRSFIKGWFYPFADSGKGTFDTNIYGVEFAASNIGKEGTFEYAVACIVLMDPSCVAKAKKACRIREETVKIRY